MSKTIWEGRVQDYPLENYPDYSPGKPPQVLESYKYSYLDEYEQTWGQKWGSIGIGRLREVGLIKPEPDWEGSALWKKDPAFFCLRHTKDIDGDLMLKNHEEYSNLLESLGIKIHWMKFEDKIGTWGPMRKLFMGQEPKLVLGGAVIPRFAHASFKRGLDREFTKFLVSIGCPILYTVHGNGIFEIAPMSVPILEGVWVVGMSAQSCNQEGLDQTLPVLYRSGVKHVQICHLQSIMDSWESGGEFHTDMVIGALDDHVVLVYPGSLDFSTYVWLKENKFKIIEIPADEQKTCYPANLITVEPGRVIMPKAAVKTIKLVEQAGIEVIPFDSSGIMQGGTNGIRCITMEMLRDVGPGLDD
jgi:N-dimethylarginine dimethylaminohydrolase